MSEPPALSGMRWFGCSAVELHAAEQFAVRRARPCRLRPRSAGRALRRVRRPRRPGSTTGTGGIRLQRTGPHSMRVLRPPREPLDVRELRGDATADAEEAERPVADQRSWEVEREAHAYGLRRRR